MYEWSRDSYVSWNYTGHGRTIFPIRKFELDARTNYLFRLHTTTFKYTSMYNFEKRQLIVRRTPLAENADDRFEFKSRYFTNRTFLFHLQVINNHYEIIGQPEPEEFSWQLHGYFRRDPLNGSLVISPSDWWFSSRVDINSSLYISTGRYVQLLPHQDPQLAVEVLLKKRFHVAFQYAGLQSLVALKVVHHSSNIDFVFSSKAINETLFNLRCQINDLINQSWILIVQDERYQLYDHQGEFSFNGSLKDLSFQHTLDDRRNILIYNEDSIELMTNEFGFLLSNRSSETSRYIHVYHRKQKQNLTIQYFSSGQFSFNNLSVQTPIYDISLTYYPTDEEHRYVKVILEFLPLQMSAFSLVRGRSFRIGYQTRSKQWMLSGNLAFSIEDFDRRQIITMDERWKLSYGLEKREKIYLKWNVRINSVIKSFQGRVTIQDPNDELSTPVYSEVQGHITDPMIIVTLRTSYSPSENQSQYILLRFNIDQRMLRQQYIAVNLIHESSATNLSFTIDRYPQRRLRITLKPNGSVEPKTLLHLYANTTESQLKLLLLFAEFIHINLTLPKSYPPTGVLHSALFMNDEEYYDGYLETSALHLRTKDHYLNISMGRLSLQERSTGQLVASIVARWIDRNSSTALITFLQPKDFSRVSTIRNTDG